MNVSLFNYFKTVSEIPFSMNMAGFYSDSHNYE